MILPRLAPDKKNENGYYVPAEGGESEHPQLEALLRLFVPFGSWAEHCSVRGMMLLRCQLRTIKA
jgi:hypothetical protein